MATTVPARGFRWPALKFPSSTITLRNALLFVFFSMSVYTILYLTQLVGTTKYQQLVAYSQSVVSSSWLYFKHDWKGEHNTTEDDGNTSRLVPRPRPRPPPPSDELSDFHIYNIFRNSNRDAAKTWPRPQLHVLVDARHPFQERASLCRTLLSVVIQGYPPPILVGYRPQNAEGDGNESENQISSTESFLEAALDAMKYIQPHANQAKGGGGEGGVRTSQQETVVLFLRRDQWIQMPAEVTVRRYLQHKDVWSQRLAREYGSSGTPGARRSERDSNEGKKTSGNRGGKQEGRSRYRLGVLFPASRKKSCMKWDQMCALGTRDGHKIDRPGSLDAQKTREKYLGGASHRDDILPESSLPQDIYGNFLDAGDAGTPDTSSTGNPTQEHSDENAFKHPMIPTRYRRPRYLGDGSFIGLSRDVERLFEGALERISWLQADTREINENMRREGEDGAGSIGNYEDVDEKTYLFSEMFFEQELERRMRQEPEFISQQHSGGTSTKKRWLPWPMVGGGGISSLLDWFGRATGGQVYTPASTFEHVASGGQYRHEGNNSDTEYEFSIGLDYESRIFQDMAENLPNDEGNSSSRMDVRMTNDIRFLPYSVPNLVRSPSRSASHLFRQPLMLPLELLHPFSPNGTSSPFGLNSAIYHNLDTILEAARKVKVYPPADDVDQEKPREQKRRKKREDEGTVVKGEHGEDDEEREEERIRNLRSVLVKVPWSSLEFGTNLVVPRGSIPSVLDMSRFATAATETQDGGEALGEREMARQILEESWSRMWFNQKNQSTRQNEQQHGDGEHDKLQDGAQERRKGNAAREGLLGEYIKPNPFIYNLESDSWGGEHSNWWNVRGGRGGFWTDQGAWIPWADICGDVEI